MGCAQCKQLWIQQVVECNSLIYKITHRVEQSVAGLLLCFTRMLHFPAPGYFWKCGFKLKVFTSNLTAQFNAAVQCCSSGYVKQCIAKKLWGGTHCEEVAKLLRVDRKLCLRTAWRCKGFYAELRSVKQLSLFAVTKTFVLLPLREGHFL